jgi:hypothetical protein
MDGVATSVQQVSRRATPGAASPRPVGASRLQGEDFQPVLLAAYRADLSATEVSAWHMPLTVPRCFETRGSEVCAQTGMK